jgi:hypothetical protein
MVQLAPAASGVGHPVAENGTAVIRERFVIGILRLFFSTIEPNNDVSPCAVVASVCVDTDSVIGKTLVPVMATVCGLVAASCVIVRVPFEAVPGAAVGVNTIEAVQLPRAMMVEPHPKIT